MRYIGKGKKMGQEQKEEKKKFAFAFCMIAGDTQTEVHTNECRDVYRGIALYGKTFGGHLGVRAYHDVYVVEANTAEEAVEEEIEELNSTFPEDSWSKRDFTIMPCCRRR